MGRLGLQDIARDLNVSVSLVSKVLSGRLGTTGASAGTVEAIRDRARQLGYRKNLTAAALAAGKQNVIGVFIHRIGEAGSGIVEDLIKGISAEAAACGQRLLIHFFENAEQFEAFAPQANRNAVDGLLVGGIRHGELAERLAAMDRGGVPVITIHDRQIDPRLQNVATDQVEVARLATAHLIERGCRRIAFIGSPGDRRRGYEKALRQAGLPVRRELFQPTRTYDHQEGRIAAERLIASGAAFDGLVAQADPQAVAAFNALVTAGIRVPGQVKLVGIDNSPYCVLNLVPLTSVCQAFDRRGRTAVRLLLRKIGGQRVTSTCVPPVLVERASTAPGFDPPAEGSGSCN